MSPHLVGREEELDAITRAASAVAAGVGATLSIVGEAGIGKTSLIAAARRQLSGMRVLVRDAVLDETDQHRSLAVMRRLTRPCDAPAEEDGVDGAIAALEHLAAERPLALFIEDLHWSDPMSLELLRAVARRATDLGILLIVTARPWPAPPGVARLETVAASSAGALRPSALTAGQVAELAARQLDTQPDRRLLAQLAGAAGNPFLVLELLDAGELAVGAALPTELAIELPVELPTGLTRRLYARTLAALPLGEVLVPALAAVPGGASADELAALLELPFADVLRATMAGVEAGVLVGDHHTVTFQHDLVRRSVIGVTPPAIARALARRAADVLAARDADPGRITACLLDSVGAEDRSEIDRLLQAARAFRSNHPEAAADLYEAALKCACRIGTTDEELVLELGWVLIAAGRAAEVGPLLDMHLGPFHIGEPHPRLRLRGNATFLAGNIDEVSAAYLEVDDRSLMTAQAATDAEIVDSLAELAQLRVSTGRLAQAEQILDWVDSSPTPASAERRVAVANARSLLSSASGHFVDAAAHARDALARVRQDAWTTDTEVTPRLMLAIALDHLGESAAAIGVLREPARQRRLPRWGPPLLQHFAAVSLYRRGEWDDALAEVDAGLQAAEECDMGLGAFWPPSVGALISCARGDLESARAWIERADVGERSTALGRDWLALAAASTLDARGASDAAAGIAVAAANRILEAGALGLLMNGGPELTRLCLAGGHDAEARRIATALAVVAERSTSPVAHGLARWANGLVENDPTRIVAAADLLAGARRLPESARGIADAAVITAGVGFQGEARRLAKRALASFDELGAEQWWRRLRADLRPAGIELRVRGPVQRATTGWPSLTASEQTVVGLVGAGLTNSEIAGRLVVSRRTVESHLVRVYAKLGFASRAQLVAAAARRETLAGN